ncbi:NLI interacting factor-like phosphatase family protein [Tritrichomonas foetus]|uniref:NLI interacting factor-like phosphatase family protein n=1 Tax=Tritrichomonas foetus TaxID=1144522 RepID=A0A1J4KJ14_9EUKA|nr:NLI interacting factor-like phosphatase family protein [Tritrichomonas foetus]|eukprot:OHT11327.1 NLI interacting factor-like phosphatase family protein [Tritrichomonas foetus]
MSSPLNDYPDNADDNNDEEGLETHIRAKKNLDPKAIQHLENEILRTMQAGNSVVDPLFNIGLPDTSVASSSTYSNATSLYSTNSVSMESFTLDTFVTAGGATSVDYDQRFGKKPGCCASMKRQTNGASSSSEGTNTTVKGSGGNNPNDPLPPLLPPPLPEDQNKICLVLDLDETLVHSSFLSIPHADFRFVLGMDENQVGVFVCIRPGAERFLKELGNLYELVVFTASCQPYADTVIDYIDPGRVIKYRLYRDSCTDFGGNFVKDLSRLNRNLERIIIIDNSPSAYLLQPYNAIAISSWFDEPMDNELLLILDFLKQSYRVKNVYDLFSPE